MDQAKHYICTACMTGVPRGHKFCGRCGASVPEELINSDATYFSDLQSPDKARLILIHGDEFEGLSYHLKAEQHLLGRTGQLEFPNDPFISPTHANFFYRNKKLVVKDEGSLNGVFLRIRGRADLHPGDLFIAGRQVFRLDLTPKASDIADSEGTYFYSSPKQPSSFRINQILTGGTIGNTICARTNSITIGRDACDLNFLTDLQMSPVHCTVEESAGKFTLVDHDTRNGTYLRVKTETALNHGDYLFIGQKLLRVETNA